MVQLRTVFFRHIPYATIHAANKNLKVGVNPGGGEVDDPLGLDVEGDVKFQEDQLMEMFPEGIVLTMFFFFFLNCISIYLHI